MRVFRFKANVTFEAENIDDALNKLATHFRGLEEDTQPDALFTGSMEIGPDEEDEEAPK